MLQDLREIHTTGMGVTVLLANLVCQIETMQVNTVHATLVSEQHYACITGLYPLPVKWSHRWYVLTVCCCAAGKKVTAQKQQFTIFRMISIELHFHWVSRYQRLLLS